MNRPRVKVPSTEEEACYHCISRTVGRAYLFGDREKELIRSQIWLLAEYCGVEIVTYVIMSNHYHVLVRVPIRRELSDHELHRLYNLLYPKLKPQQKRALEGVIADMPVNGPVAQKWREQQKRQMFDVSYFNKLLKMRISIWYNRKNKRVGTLWEAPFKSVLVESGEALEKMAAYIDLNPVRALLVKKPEDYRFCAYTEAVAGIGRAQKGLGSIYLSSWDAIAAKYRCLLYATASSFLSEKGKVSAEEFEEVLRTKGQLPLGRVLGCRIRYFVDGAILGSHGYVAQQTARFLAGKPQVHERKPYDLHPVTDWNGLAVYTRIRSGLFA
jgi:putative transposase